ncbi:MAG: methylated-DNA--[protein]-cysteine S-methyltransferase [Euryarchaeota archaeon]|nr:methylated-DNA--[protein]-cysteine S-methyltransferase [Euryarchaeota archaeon]
MKAAKVKTKGAIRYALVPSRLGAIFVAATDRGVCRLHFPADDKTVRRFEKHYDRELAEDPEFLADVAGQLESYLSGNLRKFDCNVDFIEGTEFQRKVWKALLKIPYGETRSYQWMAERVGCPKGYRAVGGANGSNPVSLIVPCHRVIGKDGSMTGYGGPSKKGQGTKRALLRMEGAIG